MKDYKKVAEKICKMGFFCDVHNCGCPKEHSPVNLFFQLSEPYIIGFRFYVSYSFGMWRIDYTLDNSVRSRAGMQSVSNIKTDREMYKKVEEIIDEIRSSCGAGAHEKII